MNEMLLAAQAAQGGGQIGFLIMMIAIFAIMWFFMIRPQQKKQKEIESEYRRWYLRHYQAHRPHRKSC